MIRFPRVPGWISVLLSAGFWIALVLVPIAALFREGFREAVPLLDPVILFIARMTFYQAALSTVASGGIGLVLGLWAGDVFSRGNARTLRFLLLLPYGVPTVVAGLVWVGLLGQGGLGWGYSLKAVVIAHVFFNAPYVALLVAEARAEVSRSQLEAARLMGASKWTELQTVVWPMVWRAFASAVAQVMALCSMSFGLVMILGGGPPVETLETALFSRIRFGELDIAGAVACAVWELIIVMLPWTLVLLLGSSPSPARKGRRVFLGERAGSTAKLCTWVCALFFAPYLAALFGLSGESIQQALREGLLLRPTLLSLTIATLSGLGAVVFGLLAIGAMAFTGSRKLLPVLFAIPSGISVLVLGLGVWLAYGGWIDPFSGSLAAIIALQIVIFFPVAFRMFWPLLASVRMDLIEAAATLGASPARSFWWIEWPRWRKTVLGAWALGAAAALGEVAAVSFFYSENLVPLPLLITRLMGQYRFEEARVVSTFLLALAVGLVALISLLEIPDARTRANR